MKCCNLLGALVLVPVLIIGFAVLPGCNKPAENKPVVKPADPDKAAKDDTKAPTDGGKGEVLTATNDGVIKGQIVYDGAPPTPEMIAAMKTHNDKDVCLAGPTREKVDQTWLIGKNNGVANVVVWLQAPAGKAFNVTEEVLANHKEHASLDQPHCAFVPHIVAMFPEYKDAKGAKKSTGQKLLVKNSSEASHNTKISGDQRVNPTEFNQNIPPKETKGIEVEIKYQKKELNIACDKHSWMTAKLFTFNQPYFAVTDENGNFEIKNVPSGVELKVVLWHEGTGELPGEAKTFTAGNNDLSMKIGKK